MTLRRRRDAVVGRAADPEGMALRPLVSAVTAVARYVGAPAGATARASSKVDEAISAYERLAAELRKAA